MKNNLFINLKIKTMEKFITILTAVAAIALIALLMALPIMLLWNWLMPEIFELTEINFWQALGLSLLSSFLFKSSSSSSSN